MENINIIIGRFQPFTDGHLKCAQQAYKELGIKTVLCVIETTKQDSRHPFLTSQLAKIFDKMCKEESTIAGWVTVKNANIVDNIEILRDHGYEPISWTCGTDRIDSYERMVRKYGGEIGLSEDFKVIEVKRGDEDISATSVRNALRNDDERTYKSMVPKSWWDKFHYLREIIISVTEGMKSLKDYILESIERNVLEFTLDDLQRYNIWTPNDDLSRDDLNNIWNNLQKFPMRIDMIEVDFERIKHDIRFIIYYHNHQRKNLTNCIRQIINLLLESVYSVADCDNIKKLL